MLTTSFLQWESKSLLLNPKIIGRAVTLARIGQFVQVNTHTEDGHPNTHNH